MCPNVHEEGTMENNYTELSLLSLSKAAAILKIGKESLTKLINTGKIGVVMINNRSKITYQELQRYVTNNTIYYSTVTENLSFSNQPNISNIIQHTEFDSAELFNKIKDEVLNG